MTDREKRFKKELESLINRYSIDTVCNKPDYELAEIIWQLLCLIAK